jgi:hypothetical protein
VLPTDGGRASCLNGTVWKEQSYNMKSTKNWGYEKIICTLSHLMRPHSEMCSCTMRAAAVSPHSAHRCDDCSRPEQDLLYSWLCWLLPAGMLHCFDRLGQVSLPFPKSLPSHRTALNHSTTSSHTPRYGSTEKEYFAT